MIDWMIEVFGNYS